jgi:secondary thiamine-phosphate synthase enzyme
MPAHVRSVLTGSSLTLPVHDGNCLLGTWQGIYLWEHRRRGHRRRLTVTVYGD